jgi:NAD(P)-dependent dehydrogenase (short-subunit alcohol dehydrogenase family)
MTKSVLDLSKEFIGRRALITGGSRGIGAAIAQRLLDGGATVVVTARSKHEQTPKDATFVAGDLRSDEGVKAVATEALRVLGGLDILVNNAGAARVHLPGTTAISDAEWVDSVNINFLSAVRLTSAVLPSLLKSKAGAIINVSAVGAGPLPGFLAHYGAAKAALNAYTLSLAQELGPQNIRVNILTPGPIVTPGGDDVRDTILKAMGVPKEALFSKVAMRRFGESAEVAEMAALLASTERAGFITGHNYYVDGGMGAL